MFMSDINYKKRLELYIIFTIFTLLFGIIYEQFSHEIYSNYMMYAFAIPLVVLIISYLLKIFKANIYKISLDLFDAAIMTFTVGSLTKGVLEIYGTTNEYIYCYLYAGIVLIILFFISILIKKHKGLRGGSYGK